MLLLFAFLLYVFGVAFILLMPSIWGREIHHHYSVPRAVTCPETHQQVGVTIDARHAAATGLFGTAEFRLSNCTRWPERARCGQECLPEALRNEPYALGEVHVPKTHRQIYHLPVLLAGFAAWYIGMLWHSEHLFRGRWMAALGLTPAELKEIVLWYSPHLLSVAACVLFAYGVAWLQAVQHHKGIRQGILSATFLWAVILVVTLPALLSLPRDLLLIEASYTLIATIVVGTIIGGLSGKLVLPALMAR